jgi:hypothetical protein
MRHMVTTWMLFILGLSAIAAPQAEERLDHCERTIKREAGTFILSQIWFDSGVNQEDSKMLFNWSFKTENDQLIYDYTFTEAVKEKLWINCVYFLCRDSECNPENRGGIENVHIELKKTPFRCQRKNRAHNSTTVQSFICENTK